MTPPLPDGRFKVVVADPPWRFISWSRQPALVMNARSPEKHYSCLTMPQIGDLPVRDVVAPDCHLFLWATGPCIPHALYVMQRWGFIYSGMGFVWVKLRKRAEDADVAVMQGLAQVPSLLHTGLGLTTRKNAEFVLLGRRGKPKRLAADVHEIIIAPRREHSRKPDEAFERIARYAEGPRLEMFARQTRPGFTAWGDQASHFDENLGDDPAPLVASAGA